MAEAYDLVGGRPRTRPSGSLPGSRAGNMFYRPAERGTLEALLTGLQSGMDPTLALSMWQGVQGGALDRLATQRSKMQTRQATRQAVLPEMSSFATETAMAGLPPEVAQTAFSGYGPGIQGSLDDLLGSLYPGGATQSPFMAQPETAEAQQLAAEDLETIEEDVRNWADGTAKQPNGLPMGLHEATMAVVGQLRVQGYPEETLGRVRQYVASLWTQFGGPTPPGTVTSGLTEAQLRAAAQNAPGAVGGFPWQTNRLVEPWG